MTPVEGLTALALYLFALVGFSVGRWVQRALDARRDEERAIQIEALRAQVVKPSSIDVVI